MTELELYTKKSTLHKTNAELMNRIAKLSNLWFIQRLQQLREKGNGCY